jgi:hypothetical protein
MTTKQTITVEGSGPDGKIIGSDLAHILNDLDAGAPIKARTTLGGWLKSLTVTRLVAAADGGTGTGGEEGQA